jgi:hypothetical protein
MLELLGSAMPARKEYPLRCGQTNGLPTTGPLALLAYLVMHAAGRASRRMMHATFGRSVNEHNNHTKKQVNTDKLVYVSKF